MQAWALAHPWMTLAIAYLAFQSIDFIVNRLLRHLNIRSKGWPPMHLDADGDFQQPPEVW